MCSSKICDSVVLLYMIKLDTPTVYIIKLEIYYKLLGSCNRSCNDIIATSYCDNNWLVHFFHIHMCTTTAEWLAS